MVFWQRPGWDDEVNHADKQKQGLRERGLQMWSPWVGIMCSVFEKQQSSCEVITIIPILQIRNHRHCEQSNLSKVTDPVNDRTIIWTCFSLTPRPLFFPSIATFKDSSWWLKKRVGWPQSFSSCFSFPEKFPGAFLHLPSKSCILTEERCAHVGRAERETQCLNHLHSHSGDS